MGFLLIIFIYNQPQMRLQPTPTDIIYNENITMLERMIFYELWMMTRNEDWKVSFVNWNKRFDVELKRWQVIAKITKISQELEIDPKLVRRSIENISKRDSEMEIESKPYWLLITWVWYDEKIKMESKMENKRRIKGEWVENKRRANNKSVESVEIVKSGEIPKKYFDSDLLNSKFNEFIEYKKDQGKKKELTQRWITTYINRFNKRLKNWYTVQDIIDCIDEAFIHNREWIFEKKDKKVTILTIDWLSKEYEDMYIKHQRSGPFLDKYWLEIRDAVKKYNFSLSWNWPNLEKDKQNLLSLIEKQNETKWNVD